MTENFGKNPKNKSEAAAVITKFKVVAFHKFPISKNPKKKKNPRGKSGEKKNPGGKIRKKSDEQI